MFRLFVVAACLAFSSIAYMGVKYVPIQVERAKVRALVQEIGRRAATTRDDRRQLAWFERRAREEGLGWLHADQLHWFRPAYDTLEVGVAWDVRIPHLLGGEERRRYAFHCRATVQGCTPFTPEWMGKVDP